MPVETLTELQYSADRKGPFKLYIYEANSQYHRGGIWFRNKPLYPEEEITTALARERAAEAMASGREVRVCDGGDELVFHAKGKVIMHPGSGNFWDELK